MNIIEKQYFNNIQLISKNKNQPHLETKDIYSNL